VPAHVQQRKRPALIVERGAADDDESKCLVEAARRGVLLVDVDGQVATAQRLGVRHQLASPAAAQRFRNAPAR
jgi:hypothetical protein